MVKEEDQSRTGEEDITYKEWGEEERRLGVVLRSRRKTSRELGSWKQRKEEPSAHRREEKHLLRVANVIAGRR